MRNRKAATTSESARCCTTCRTDHFPGASGVPSCSRLYHQQEDADRAIVDAVAAVATTRGVPMAQVALAWVRQQPAVTAPIVGATKQQHLDDALASLELTLTDDELAALAAPYVPQRPEGF